MTLEEYLKDRKHIFWNFTDDFRCEKYEEISGTVDKYFAYRASKPEVIKCFPQGAEFAKICNSEFKDVQDPDAGSVLLQEIYKNLWPALTRQEFMLKKKWIQSDHMTSAQRTLNLAIEFLLETKEEAEYRESFGTGVKVCDSYCVDMYANNPEGLKDRFSGIPGLTTFLGLYHTLGNYIAVPKLFNGARSGHYASHDYWDLTLQKVREWYLEPEEEKKDQKIRELLHNRGDLEACRKWLSYFGDDMEGWIKFVDSYYLQDFVDHEYRPIPFCKSHSWENVEVSDCVEVFLNVNRMIYLRGVRMFNALNKNYVASKCKEENKKY